MKIIHTVSVGLSLLAVSALGCGSSADKTAPAGGPKLTTGAGGASQDTAGGSGHSHEGWWCAEHGVPEDVCAQCNSKVAAKLKAKGDWCEEHGVPESQCFVCNPEFEKKFAAQYEAKYGKQPPPRDAEEGAADEDGHDHEHGA